jgi:hypothetical protein
MMHPTSMSPLASPAAIVLDAAVTASHPPLSSPLHRSCAVHQRAITVLGTLGVASGIIILMSLNKLPEPFGAALFFLGLFALIAWKADAAFVAFLIGSLGLVTNMALVPKTSLWTVCRILLPMVCLVRFSLDLLAINRTLFQRLYFWAFLGFIAVATLSSIISGYYMHIALLKLLLFTIGVTAVFSGVMVLRERRTDLTPWLVSLAAVVVINGFASLILGVGYGRSIQDDLYASSTLFQGPFFHPNACGPLSALLAVFMAAIFVFTKRHGRWIAAVLIPPLIYFLWLSRSRTGLLTLVAGIILLGLFIAFPFATSRGRITKNLSMVGFTAITVAALLFAALANLGSGGAVFKGVTGFLNKYSQTTDNAALTTEQLMASRRGLIDRSWALFLERPLTGLGFQVSVDPYFVKNATLWTAPVEKGFLPTALLEETGILGTIMFVMFLSVLSYSLWHERNLIGLLTLCMFVIINFGEVVIFAIGGAGGFGWMLIGAAMIIGDQSTAPAASIPRRQTIL